ncbi:MULTISPECIES: efflux RND transporter periplasmic adaptor subunit [Flavobacterium]|jgi:membrane fusion protein, multidrug efflux system|uniref:Efflux transporter periplasmic adaptor subunit n=1 Tax=Flavobacterium tructae TaxID=1114873 RepID=A0A1S1J6N0_9FLAO|nr:MULTISPECIES: efflux RND transporter periplasmic adaptor subunit [Flavobacterium]MDL2141149.1 efflux RND transporter periplasmic adaptor subunit [Flavobacterium tructae]OHT46312.1 efflux transporter periplasmic adaptor subunit [Flavobacterium tructae]OXB22274.1 efflux transporter periplasmic adaptor subunit [Flavobacterium tructae]OXB24239.1 efflux transporter periplasmic adaptor subunit [Flavobacterium tructae]URC13892.1 efflux RND transporter periplasmic adaptor subunit [Flavobacterium sp
MKKTIITIVIIIASLGVIGYILNKNKKENKEKTDIVAEKNAAVSVKVSPVKTEEVSLDFVANGNFQPTQQLTFSAEKSGKVISVLAKEGDYVRVGQTLLTMRGDVINVDAQTAEAAYQNAKSDYMRYENAYKTGGVTKQQVDQAKLALTNAQSHLTQAKINVGDTRVKAPISGFINKKYIEPGSILTGMPATALFDIVNVSKLKLVVTVNENQVASLKTGDHINVTASVYPDKNFSGKITFIAAKADESLNFPVEIEITNNVNNDLKAGMYGTANFASKQQKQNLMVVPRNAFVGSVSSNQIFVVEKGIAKLRKVTAGRILGDKVEIINGLTDGETVIVTGQINLQDGNTVEIIK